MNYKSIDFILIVNFMSKLTVLNFVLNYNLLLLL